jgi:hypothetical protein
MAPNKLTDSIILGIAPSASPTKHADGAGLYLLVNTNGSRYWRFNYRAAGKRNTLSLGVYPSISIDQARAKRDQYRALLANGLNPSDYHKAERAEMERARAASAEDAKTRFYLDSDGALSVRLSRRVFALTPQETIELHAFMSAGSGLISKE